MERNDENENERLNDRDKLPGDERENQSNPNAGSTDDYLDGALGSLAPDSRGDVRNWNSISGVPRGDRSRVLDNSPNEAIEDDTDDIFEDDDDDEVL